MALITVLLVVSLATIAAVAMASRQQLDIRRAENLLDADQADLYAQGAEQWAEQLLARDAKRSQVDTLGEDWAKTLPAIPVEGGAIAGSMDDLQGRFNINSLYADGKVNTVALARFRRLLAEFELDPELSAAVIDWLDPNIDPTFPGGAEDNAYLAGEQPYRAADGPMVSPSELLRVKGFTYDGYAKLAPFICALPVATSINVNTAPAEVLMTLADGLSKADGDALVSERGTDGYKDVNSFLQSKILAGKGVAADGLSVSSSYFLLKTNVLVGRIKLRRQSVIRRDNTGKVSVIMRAQGEL